MKLSELKPCRNCGKMPVSHFYVVRTSMAFFSPKAAQQILGLNTYFGGALGLAELFSPDPEMIKIAGNENPILWTEYLLCMECYMSKVTLAELAEKEA